MRRFIGSAAAVFTIALGVCVFATSAQAQLFRRTPNRNISAGGFGTFPVVPTPRVRYIQGSFNPTTGLFSPSATGQYVVSSRTAFEPMRGKFVPAPNGDFILTTREAFDPKTGGFKPSATGNFIFQQRGILTPNAGTFVKSSGGDFNPRTGTFVPSTTGSTTLSSNGVFVPSNGTFVPSPMGTFVLAMRGGYDPKTGAFVPSPTGTIDFTTRGTFVPSTSFAKSAGIPMMPAIGPFAPLSTETMRFPISNVNPVNPRPVDHGMLPLWQSYLAMLNNAAQARGNPYIPIVPTYGPSQLSNPYMATTPYGSAGYSSGYSYPPPNAYGSYGSGAQANNYGAQANAIPAYSAPSPQKEMTPLDAFGVPSEKGGVAWPLAFRLMSPDQRKELLQPAEASLVAVTTQAAQGQVNPRFVDEARLGVAKLRSWLRGKRADLADGTYADADRFLRRADDALDAMKN